MNIKNYKKKIVCPMRGPPFQSLRIIYQVLKCEIDLIEAAEIIR